MKDLSLHLMDILQNSISAKADLLKVCLQADSKTDLLLLSVSDNGKGMEPQFAVQADNPFVTTRDTRKIGLGIPLLKASAAIAEGELRISSAAGNGTTVEASFKISHIDRLPIGDIAQTITNTIAAYPKIDIILELKSKNGDFLVSTTQMKERLGEVSITEYVVLNWIKDYINEGVMTIFGGVLNEIAG